MAMHNSQDVGETVATMFDELVKLRVETVRCGIAIIDESKTMEVWTASSKEDGSVKLIIGQLDMRSHPLFMQVYDAWKQKKADPSLKRLFAIISTVARSLYFILILNVVTPCASLKSRLFSAP